MNYNAGQFDPGGTVDFPVAIAAKDNGAAPSSQAYYAQPFASSGVALTTDGPYIPCLTNSYPAASAPGVSGLVQGRDCSAVVGGVFHNEVRLDVTYGPAVFVGADGDVTIDRTSAGLSFSVFVSPGDRSSGAYPAVSINNFAESGGFRVSLGQNALASYLTPVAQSSVFVGSLYAYYTTDANGNHHFRSHGPFSASGTPANPGDPNATYAMLHLYYLPVSYVFTGPLNAGSPYRSTPPCCVAAHWDWIDGADRHYTVGDTPNMDMAFTPPLLSASKDILGAVQQVNPPSILFTASFGVLPNPYKATGAFVDADASPALLSGFGYDLAHGGPGTTYADQQGQYSTPFSSPAAKKSSTFQLDLSGNVLPLGTATAGDLLSTTAVLFAVTLKDHVSLPLAREYLAQIVGAGNYSPTPFRLRVDYVLTAQGSGTFGGSVAWQQSPLVYNDGPRYLNVTVTNTPGDGPPPPPSFGISGFLALDAHRRPLAAAASPADKSGALGYYSNDAGHSFKGAVIDSDPTCADISLLVDHKANQFSALYTKGEPGKTALFTAFGPITDSFTPDTVPALAAGLSGAFAVAAQHPTDRELTLALLLSGTELVSAQSADFGRSWTAGGVVAGGLDFSKSGRAGLAWLGDAAFALYASGKALVCAQSLDQGLTWTDPASMPATVAMAGPYSGVSLLGWQGTLYVLAFHSPDPKSSPLPVLLRSGGEAWAAMDTLPAITSPSALGVLALTGRLRLGLTHFSPDDGQSWTPN